MFFSLSADLRFSKSFQISDIAPGSPVLLIPLTSHLLPSADYVWSWRRQADGHLPGERAADASRGGPDIQALPPRALLPEESHPPAAVARPLR